MSQKANILIVDDEEVVRLSHLRCLLGTDCNTQVAQNGNEAIRVMEQHPFDVILLDLRMPDLNGLDVLKVIKARWPTSEVIIITGYPSIESAKEAVRLGAYNYLAKPLEPNPHQVVPCVSWFPKSSFRGAVTVSTFNTIKQGNPWAMACTSRAKLLPFVTK